MTLGHRLVRCLAVIYSVGNSAFHTLCQALYQNGFCDVQRSKEETMMPFLQGSGSFTGQATS